MKTDETLQKLLRLALDPAASEGEIHNASILIVDIARKRGMDKNAFLQAIGIQTTTEGFDYRDIRLDFGKHRGKTVGDIMHIDPGYLYWCNENATHISYAMTKAIKTAVKDLEAY